MTAIAFPAPILGTGIPVDGFGHKRNPAAIRTDMESGLPRGRVTNRNPLRRVTIKWHWNSTQVTYFNSWLEYRARYTSAWFAIDLPLDGDLRGVLARFVEEPEQRPFRRARWEVTAQLDVRDTNALSSDVFDLIEAYGSEGTQAMAAAVASLSLQPFFDAWDPI